jgi:outer membrane protein OmpA-like peptidoglycan-associated protein
MKNESSDSLIPPDEAAVNPTSGQASLEALRELILEPEQTLLKTLQTRLDDPENFAREVSRVIPQAILLRTTQDHKLSKALTPTIEEAIKTSVNRNPQPIVDAISPAMGPSIRKAITETIRRMIQSFNQALERSMSWQGLKWRFESWRTGKSFAEVVMLHSLVYQVEQAFLIHRESGLSLHHVLAEDTIAQDADMVSAMLTAIRDFVHDSFGSDQGDTLETMRVGDRTVWVESGPQAVLAIVIRGNPPAELRDTLQEVNEQIHLLNRKQLLAFEGDTTPFESVHPMLLDCLKAQYKEKKRKTSPLLWISGLVVISLLVAALSWSYIQYRSASSCLTALVNEPGIRIVSSRIQRGSLHVSGFRDALAKDPNQICRELAFPAKRIEMDWEPYYSLKPEFVLERAKKILNPPSTVTLTLENGTLHAKGRASNAWIVTVSEHVTGLPGIHSMDLLSVVNIDRKALENSIRKLNTATIRFDAGKSDFLTDDDHTIQGIISDVKTYLDHLDRLNENRFIELVGHADTSGTESWNRELSLKRAEQVKSMLTGLGVSPLCITTRGAGSSEPVCFEDTPECKKRNRSVTFNLENPSGQ